MYSYGFGYFGSFNPWQLAIFATVFFVIQILVSKFWLQHYCFGPIEWLWCRLIYLNN